VRLRKRKGLFRFRPCHFGFDWPAVCAPCGSPSR